MSSIAGPRRHCHEESEHREVLHREHDANACCTNVSVDGRDVSGTESSLVDRVGSGLPSGSRSDYASLKIVIFDYFCRPTNDALSQMRKTTGTAANALTRRDRICGGVAIVLRKVFQYPNN